MAFSGFHVVFGYAGGKGAVEDIPLLSRVVSSETMDTAATTTITAPSTDVGLGDPVAVIRAAADSWFSVGPAPGDPSSASTTRDLVLVGERLERFVKPGDKVRWAAA